MSPRNKEQLAALDEQRHASYLETLLRESITAVLKTGDPTAQTWASNYESDRRRVVKCQRVLIESGHLETRTDPATSITTTWRTGLAYEQLEAVKPNLTGGWDADRPRPTQGLNSYRWLHGRAFGDPPPAGQKYILENRTEYIFRAYKAEGDTARELNRFKPGKLEWGEHVMVSSEELDRLIAETLKEEEFERIYGLNLVWGLEDLTGVTEADVKSAMSSDHPFSRSSSESTRESIKKWFDDIEKRIDRADERALAQTNKAAALRKIQNAVDTGDGWPAFLEKYEERLRDDLAKEKS